MKQKTTYYYKKPFIKVEKIRINFFSSPKFNFGGGDLLASYCGQCVLSGDQDACPSCVLPPGCDAKSC